MSENIVEWMICCKVCEGFVVFDKMNKMIIVMVEDCVKYLLYGKVMIKFVCLKVYDENNEVGMGDCVWIMEICLLLVIKCWCFVEIIEKVK